ncbi:hypothetical protein Tco_0890083 [Tanacetum coccineum]
MGYSFYSPSENKVFVARNAEFFESKLLDLKASGSVEDLEEIQEEDTNPSVETSLNHEEDDQEIDEPQSDINPIQVLFNEKALTWMVCKYTSIKSSVAKGYQTYGVDYEEPFLLLDIRAIRILHSLPPYYDYGDMGNGCRKNRLPQMDISREVYIGQPEGFVKSKISLTMDANLSVHLLDLS